MDSSIIVAVRSVSVEVELDNGETCVLRVDIDSSRAEESSITLANDEGAKSVTVHIPGAGFSIQAGGDE